MVGLLTRKHWLITAKDYLPVVSLRKLLLLSLVLFLREWVFLDDAVIYFLLRLLVLAFGGAAVCTRV